jgi:hypothetical protein
MNYSEENSEKNKQALEGGYYEKYLKYKKKYLDSKNINQEGGAGEFLSLYGKPLRESSLGDKYNDYFEGRNINENGVHLKATIYTNQNNPEIFLLYISSQDVVVKPGEVPYRPTSDIFSILGKSPILQITKEQFKHFAENIVNKGINWEIKYAGIIQDNHKTGDIIRLPGIWVYNNITEKKEEKKIYLLEAWSEMIFGKKKK